MNLTDLLDLRNRQRGDTLSNDLMKENRALVASVEAAIGDGSPEEAQRHVAALLPTIDSTTIEGKAKKCALQMILGQQPRNSTPPRGSHPTAQAWVAWATETDADRSLKDALAKEDRHQGAIANLANAYWREAVIELLDGTLDSAEEPYRKATELSLQLHLDAQTLLWTYAATFFPHR